MPVPRQTPRSLVLPLGSLAMSLFVATAGCSSAELASVDDYEQGDESGTADTTGDPTTDESTEGTTETDSEAGTETGETGEDDGMIPEFEDPGLALEGCDPLRPAADQFVAYDLRDAQLELVATLVSETVLYGTGEVPQIPLGAQAFFNHFEFHYPAAETSELAISGELWKPPMANAEAPTRYRLQYALRAPAVLAEQRTPVDLAIVVDVGPSMVGEPLELAEEALAALEGALVPGDRITLIAASEQPTVLASGVIVENFGATTLTGLLGEQPPAAAANIDAALELAYESVSPYWAGQGQQRVLLVSNGHFQLAPELIGLVQTQSDADRYLVTLALGDPASIANNSLLELAAQGRGPLLYDRDPAELWRDLNERFASHMIAAGTDLEVSLTLPTGLVVRERDASGAKQGEPARAQLGANDLLIFHHELETCGEVDPNGVVEVVVEWNDPLTNEAKQSIWSQPVDELGYGTIDTRKGAAVVAYARALRGYRDGVPATDSFGVVLDAISLIADALEAEPEDADLIEMSQVLGKLEG